jgi:replicative DNA helicase Mcm
VEYAPYLGEGLSAEGGKLTKAPLSKVWRLKAPEELVNIKTITGKELTLTPETKLLTIQDGKLTWKQAQEIGEGDYVATLRVLDVEERRVHTLELLRDLDGLVIHGVEERVKELIEKATENLHVSKRELARKLGVSESMLYYNWVNPEARGNIRMKHLRALIELAGESLETINAEEVSLQAGTRPG